MLRNIHNLPRSIKRLMFFATDLALIPVSLFVAFALRYGDILPHESISRAWVLFAVMTAFGAVVTLAYRLNQIKLHAFENRALMQLGLAAITLALSSIVISYLFKLSGPRSIPLIFGAVFFILAVSVRITGFYAITFLRNLGHNRVNVIIYGAGAAGIQMAAALRQSSEARPVAFVDDNPNLHGLMIAGLPVYQPARLEKLIHRRRVERILLAIPSISAGRRDVLLAELARLPVEVRMLPSYVDLMNGKGLEENLRTVTPDQLLGRESVDLDAPEITRAYAGRVVMVTGAGGSIGSELCRQLVNCKPARIVVFEQGEFQIYSIDRDLRPMAEAAGIKVTTRLGSVTNRARVTGVIAEEKVEIILHAAAYKHVPLVEENELEGVCNNVLGTQIVAEAADAAAVERFILISTDKAVRPTNIMGASKRIAELVVQDIQTRSKHTKFAMVRFGNVLGSSGSVLPLFQKQIKAGGPVTVTHPEVTRFFMTIPEASRLVLLAGAYARGGDVFVLDMGKPQKIIDIARQMITLSGRKVKEPGSRGGDIEIKITGLRPGEKLYEELLIDNKNLRPTPHPKILCAEEAMLSQIEVASMLREIQAALDDADAPRLRRLIRGRVEGYHEPLKAPA